MLRCWRVTPDLRALSCSHSRYGRCSQMIVVKHQPSAYLQLPAGRMVPLFTTNAVLFSGWLKYDFRSLSQRPRVVLVQD